MTYGADGRSSEAAIPLTEPIYLPVTLRARVLAGDTTPGTTYTVPVFNPLATYANLAADAVTPYTQLWSLSWQRELRRNYVFEVGYTGSHSLGQINQLQANPAILTPAQIATVQSTRSATSIPSAQARRVFPQFGSTPHKQT